MVVQSLAAASLVVSMLVEPEGTKKVRLSFNLMSGADVMPPLSVKTTEKISDLVPKVKRALGKTKKFTNAARSCLMFLVISISFRMKQFSANMVLPLCIATAM